MTTATETEDQTLDEDQLLDLDELTPKRRAVLLNGKRYEVKTPQEMSIEEEQEYRSELGEYSELMRRGKLNKGEKAKLRARLDYLFDKVIFASATEKAKFNDRQRQQVVGVFTIALRNEDSAALEAGMTPEMRMLMERARELALTTAS